MVEYFPNIRGFRGNPLKSKRLTCESKRGKQLHIRKTHRKANKKTNKKTNKEEKP